MSQPRAVVLAHKMTREPLATYPSLTEAASEARVSVDVLSRKCRCQELNEDETYYRFAEKFDPAESFAGRQHCPVVIVDKETREWAWFPTAKACAGALDIPYATVVSAISKKGLLGHEYHVRYAPRRIEPAALTKTLATGRLPKM